jgi:hypothetical protein
MLMRRVSAKDKINNGPVRAALVAGVAVGVATASLGGIGTASGTCIGISGIDINFGGGGGCTTTFGNFALGLGDGTVATATNGFINGAIAIGTDINAIAGTGSLDFFNFALNGGNATDGASSTVSAGGGGFNLAANLGGNANLSGLSGQEAQDMEISAGDGFGNVALNVVGNRNRIRAEDGFLNFATNVGSPFSYPNASDNDITASGSLSAAFNSQTFLGEPCSVSQCGNTVTANGPFSLVVAAGVVRKLVEGGITFANSFNSDDFGDNPNLDDDPNFPDTTVLAAGNRFAPTTFANGSSNRSGGGQLSASLTNSGKQFRSSLKKLSDGVKNALGSLGKKKQSSEPNPDADS